MGTGLSLQANNIPIKCEKPEVAFATSSVPAYTFLDYKIYFKSHFNCLLSVFMILRKKICQQNSYTSGELFQDLHRKEIILKKKLVWLQCLEIVFFKSQALRLLRDFIQRQEGSPITGNR